jgi:spore photoproduct lyase
VEHNGHTRMRISVNPDEIIKRAEIGTARLMDRIAAANKMYGAGYRVGINVAPIVLTDDWMKLYAEMFDTLKRELDDRLQAEAFFELIFMTYGLANEKINKAALPGTMDLFEKGKMKPKGRGKYHYKPELSTDAAGFFRAIIADKFPRATISYIV